MPLVRCRLPLVVSIALGAGACSPAPFPSAKATAWPEADQLFRNDPTWIGGDAAYSVALAPGRVLWLFGDSFIATSPARLRSQAKMVRNSVAIQSGGDPSAATIAFSYRTLTGAPASFFAEDGAEWFWPGASARLDGGLLIFLLREHAIPTGLGFESIGTKAVRIANPDDPPAMWALTDLAVPTNAYGVAVGAGGAWVESSYLYVYSPVEPGNHDVYLTRFPVAAAGQGDLSGIEWYTGAQAGWVAQARLIERPKPVFAGGQTELSVHYDATVKQYVELQVDGFGGANLAVRNAFRVEGPFSTLQSVFTPLESGTRGLLVYSAKAHPELAGAEVVATYCTNSTDFNALVNDMNIYYPRFVKLRLAAAGATAADAGAP